MKCPARLVRISHHRCDEIDGTEYILAPPEMSDEEILAITREISEEMIRGAKVISESPLKPGHHPNFEDYPHNTVAEVLAAHEEEKRVWDEWRTSNLSLLRNFEARLEERGLFPLWKTDNDEETGVAEIDVHWGHNHGLMLNYKRFGEGL